MKKIIQSRMFLVIICGIIFTSIGVYAVNYMASDVTYKPKNKEWKVSNVNDAIDSLYNSRKCNMNGTEPVISGDLIPITLSNDGTVDESYWSYISSTFQVSPQNHYDVQIHGLGYDVVLAPNSGQYIRPVITVASYDIE